MSLPAVRPERNSLGTFHAYQLSFCRSHLGGVGDGTLGFDLLSSANPGNLAQRINIALRNFRCRVVGSYHKMSEKHLHRYIAEFARRHKKRSVGTEDQIAAVVRGVDGNRLWYVDLVAD